MVCGGWSSCGRWRGDLIQRTVLAMLAQGILWLLWLLWLCKFASRVTHISAVHSNRIVDGKMLRTATFRASIGSTHSVCYFFPTFTVGIAMKSIPVLKFTTASPNNARCVLRSASLRAVHQWDRALDLCFSLVWRWLCFCESISRCHRTPVIQDTIFLLILIFILVFIFVFVVITVMIIRRLPRPAPVS